MARLSATIMAHPVRAEFVTELQATLDRDVPVIWDTEGPPSADRERRWRTGRAAWETHDPDADFHMVIQDDAIASQDLLAGLEQALNHLPDTVNIISPYLGTKRPAQLVFTRLVRDAEKAGASWARSLSLSWGVAIICRTATIPPMLEWCDTRKGLPYDTRIGRYYRDHLHQDCWYTWPSLVDHRQAPSLIAHSDEGRYAHRFHQGSALELTWDGLIVADPRVQRAEILAQRRVRLAASRPPQPAVDGARPARLQPRPITLRP